MAGVFKRDGDARYTLWHFDWSTGKKRRAYQLAYTDKTLSLKLARTLEDQARARRDGTIDAVTERMGKHAQRPLAEHVEEYRQYLAGKAITAKRIVRVISAVKDASEACEWKTIPDIDGPRLQTHVCEMQADGIGKAAINGRLQAVKSFTRWLVVNHRTTADPLLGVKLLRAADDVRRVRRALTDQELAALIRASGCGGDIVTIPKRYRIRSGKNKGKLRVGIRRLYVPRRAMLYRLAAGTGFRLHELRSLTPRSFKLDDDTPTVTVEAGYSKRRQRDVQPIRRDLAELLDSFLDGLPEAEPIWSHAPDNMAPVVAADLRRARAAWIRETPIRHERRERRKSTFLSERDEAGRVADFHALRHTFITRLAQAGISPKVAQSLARHSTITLTMDRYAHVRLADEAAALEALPISQDEAARPAAQDGRRSGRKKSKTTAGAQHRAQHDRCTEGVSGALPFTFGTPDSGTEMDRHAPRKPYSPAELRATGTDDARPCNEKATRGTRTRDLRFTKAPLYRLS